MFSSYRHDRTEILAMTSILVAKAERLPKAPERAALIRQAQDALRLADSSPTPDSAPQTPSSPLD